MNRTNATRQCWLRVRIVTLAASIGVLLAGGRGLADDPVYWMEAAATASEVSVSLYDVKPGSAEAFVDAMVSAGPFSRMLSGFANEKIVQALPLATPQLASASDGAAPSEVVAWAMNADPDRGAGLLYSISRYHDIGTAERVDVVRDPVIKPHLRAAPMRYRARVIEHLVPDWGWERGVKPIVVRMSTRADMDRIFGRDGTCLGFFKSGYTGQIGLVEMFAPSAKLEEIRETLSSRPGMSGATLMQVPSTGQYLAYSEFFRAPKGTAKRQIAYVPVSAGVEGGRAGMVVENYFSR